MNRTETEACISPVLSTAGLGAVLTYRTSGHNRACGQAIGANGAGDFSVLIFGTPDDADNHARDILRKLESRGYRIESANIVRNEDGWGGSPITTAQAPNAALNIALGGNDSTSTENLIDSHEFDVADVGLIALCRKLMAENSELEAERDQLAAQNEAMRAIVESLWQIIDDIDTYSDMAKADNILFRSLVERRQKDRWETGITTDGYSLDLHLPNIAAEVLKRREK